MTVAERIQLTRKKKGLSQTELAEMTGLNKKSLSRYELGASVPPADSLLAIADALHVSTDYLLTGQNAQIKDKKLFQKFEIIQDIDDETKKVVDNFLELIIRDFHARKAYAN